MNTLIAPPIGPDILQYSLDAQNYTNDLIAEYGEHVSFHDKFAGVDRGATIVQFAASSQDRKPAAALSIVQHDLSAPKDALVPDEWTQKYKIVCHSQNARWQWARGVNDRPEDAPRISYYPSSGMADAPAGNLLRTYEAYADIRQVICKPLTQKVIRRLLAAW